MTTINVYTHDGSKYRAAVSDLRTAGEFSLNAGKQAITIDGKKIPAEQILKVTADIPGR